MLPAVPLVILYTKGLKKVIQHFNCRQTEAVL